ncbi:MAG TPA: hypothetical protein VNU68_27350 [Verrucomicrobiae bacterium]|nr:hypothetical protein [Verrucomicrobiae bacterium]
MAQLDPAKLANLDTRRQNGAGGVTFAVDRAAAAADLQKRIPGLRIHLDEVVASPKFIYNSEGFLSGPDSEENRLPPQDLDMIAKRAAPASPEDPYRPNEPIFSFGEAFQVANPNPLRQWIRNFSVW